MARVTRSRRRRRMEVLSALMPVPQLRSDCGLNKCTHTRPAHKKAPETSNPRGARDSRCSGSDWTVRQRIPAPGRTRPSGLTRRLASFLADGSATSVPQNVPSRSRCGPQPPGRYVRSSLDAGWRNRVFHRRASKRGGKIGHRSKRVNADFHTLPAINCRHPTDQL